MEEMARKESEARKLMETLSSSFKRGPIIMISSVSKERRKFIINVSEA